LNGTHPEALQEAIREASSALREALEKLAETCPNGRDYYPQGDGALRVALAEHAARMEHLRTVDRELLTLFEAIEAAKR
jgi:hypothetical protein